MNILNGIVNDLREKKLWPIALVLLAALVAVPVLLSKSSSSTPEAQVPVTGAATPSAPALPAVSVSTSVGTHQADR